MYIGFFFTMEFGITIDPNKYVSNSHFVECVGAKEEGDLICFHFFLNLIQKFVSISCLKGRGGGKKSPPSGSCAHSASMRFD